MCVIYFSFEWHRQYPLILLANRDESYERPTAAAGYWHDHANIFAGRDLRGGGTWLGVTDEGRFAAVTNYRDPSARAGTSSRGELVADFLKSAGTPKAYCHEVAESASSYSGFNLLVGEFSPSRREVFYYSNRGSEPRQLLPGIYGLSNHLLDTPWPKVESGKAHLDLLPTTEPIDRGGLFDILFDRTVARDDQLPSTGVPFEIEKAISAIFIETPGYGTRSSTVLTFDRDLKWEFDERTWV